MSDSEHIPAYCRHRASGQAAVRLNGRDFYLGKWKSAASREMYYKLIREWLAAGRQLPTDPNAITVAEITAAFLKHAKTYYAESGEWGNYRDAAVQIPVLYRRTPAIEFGPLALKAVQGAMIQAGLSRKSINRRIDRIRRIFRWAASNEMLPGSVPQNLDTVEGLKAGRSEARETAPVKPVQMAYVEAILPLVSDQVAAMIRLQLLTGARPGELCELRGCELDTTGKAWAYRPEKHKTAHHGHKRSIYFGPKAQEILRSFLKTDLHAHVFSPADAERRRRSEAAAARTTPVRQSNAIGTNRSRRPARSPGTFYSVASYRRAIARACEQAFEMPDEIMEPSTVDAKRAEKSLPEDQQLTRRRQRSKARSVWRAEYVWHPHQLRHNAATAWRKQFGPDATLTLLGDKNTRMVDVYAEKDENAAMRIMAEVG